MRNTIIIAGHGKLAVSIMEGMNRYLDNYRVDSLDNLDKYAPESLIIVHIGSGRELPRILEYCGQNRVPLVQGATGITGSRKDYNFTFIDAPNFNILMLKFMYMIRECGHLFSSCNVSVTESHQHEKKSMPGTAVEIADSLGAPHSDIKSVRDPLVQENVYGIPAEFLPLHAFHDISISDEGTVINFKTLVKGHESYISGLAKIITAAAGLEERYYHVLDLVKMKLV